MKKALYKGKYPLNAHVSLLTARAFYGLCRCGTAFPYSCTFRKA
jgi:hypothetical protein